MKGLLQYSGFQFPYKGLKVFEKGFQFPSKGFQLGSGLAQKYKWFFDNTDKEFEQPVDFTPTLPCTFYRDSQNVIQHDMDFSQYTGGTEIFVNLDTGSDAADGSELTPLKTLYEALTVAAAGGDSAYCIKVKSDTIFRRNEAYKTTGFTFTNKIIAIIPDNNNSEITMSQGQQSLIWSDQTGGVWSAARTTVYSVYNLTYTDINSIPIPYKYVTTLAACEAEINTWYKDATHVFVHTADGTISEPNMIVNVSGVFDITLLGTSKLYMKNVISLGVGVSGSVVVRGDSTGVTTVGEFCHNGCEFVGGRLNDVGNALTIEDVKKVYGFSSIAAYGRLDGFNYHYSNVADSDKRDCLIIGYDCASYKNGVLAASVSNNSSTAHNAVNILRINGDYSESKGPVCTDVNGCYSIYLDCNSKNSLEDDDNAYYSNQTGAPTGIDGKLIMVNCTHNGETEGSYDLFIESGVTAELYSTNFQNLDPASEIPTYYN